MGKKCCGFGHRNIFEPIENRLKEIICELINEKDVTEFYIGDMGEFDRMFAHVVRLVKREYGNIKLILVKPYFSNRLNIDKEFYNANYDDMIIPTELMGVYPKAAIEKKNRIMIDICDYVVAYINKDYGGAYKAARYANKQAKTLIYITDFIEVE